MSNGAFFTFPLSILAMGKDPRERISKGISSAILRVGNSIFQDTGKGQRSAKVSGYIKRNGRPSMFSSNDAMDVCAVLGADRLNVRIYNAQLTRKESNEVDAFSHAFSAKYGGDGLITISTEMVWRHFGDGFPTYRDFSLLCGYNSIRGLRSGAELIRRPLLIARQLGYLSPKVMQAALADRTDGARPLTTQQLRDALDRLERAGMFHRAQVSKTRTYFLPADTTPEQIEQAILNLRASKASYIQNQRRANRELWENQKRTTKREKEVNEAQTPVLGLPENQTGTKQQPQEEPQTQPQEEPLNEKSFIKSLSLKVPQDDVCAPRAREAKQNGEEERGPLADAMDELQSEAMNESKAAAALKAFKEDMKTIPDQPPTQPKKKRL